MKKIDAIILTYTINESYHEMTLKCIETLRASDPFDFDIKIIETSEEDWEYPGCKVVHISPFGYNKAVNMGLALCESDTILVLNNDLIFHKGWLTSILQAMDEGNYSSASPRCPNYYIHENYTDDTIIESFATTTSFCGWCLVFKRDAIMSIYPLDEDFTFLYQDTWVAEELAKRGHKHALIGKSKVTHLLSQSLKLIPPDRDDDMYSGAHKIYERKRRGF